MKIVLFIAVCMLGYAISQDVCSKARDCKKVAFVYAFTQDTDPDKINAAEADKIKADVRKCFMPCAESARKIAKLQVAAGDPLFDVSVSKPQTSGRGRGRISNPRNPWQSVSTAQRAQANGKVALAVRRTQSSPRRVARQAPGADASCIANILGMSAFQYLEQCQSGASPSVGATTQSSVTAVPTTTSYISSIRNQFRGRGNGRGRGKRQSAKFNGKADANGELLYMFAYSKEIATRVCPDKRASILQCVQTATKGRVNLDQINANTVKSRYCQVETDCEKKKTDCILSLAQEQQKSCSCQNEMKAKVGGKCELPPSPCDSQFQSDPPRRDNSGDVCEAAVPTSAEIIVQLRKKHGAGDYELQADERKKNKGNNGKGNGNGNRFTTRRTPRPTTKRPITTRRPTTVTAQTQRPVTTTRASAFDRLNGLFNRFSGGRGK